MSKSIPVERATIYLGDIELAVLKLPNGDYQLSQTQITEAVGKDESVIRRWLTSQAGDIAQKLDGERVLSSGIKGKVRTSTGGATTVNLCSVVIAAAFWRKEAKSGSDIALDLLAACAADSIHSWADKAFGINRTEQEERFLFEVFRKFMKETRLEFTDAIQEHMVINQITGPQATFMYANASDAINRILFGKTAKQLRIENKCSITRDGLTFAQVRDIEDIEKTSARLIRDLNLNPVEAVKKAALLHNL